MKINEEIENYINFCEENFPNSYFKLKSNKVLLKEIYISLELIGIYKSVSKLAALTTFQRALSDLEHLLLNLLYVFPTNSSLYYSSCIRGISEICLRISYLSIIESIEYDKVNKLNFRTIQETLKKQVLFKLTLKENIKDIMDRFGTHSKILHNQSDKNNLDFLEEILKTQQIDINKVKKDIKVIFDFVTTSVLVMFKVSDEDLTIAQKTKISQLS